MKLKSKERFGSRVLKSYHAPQTPINECWLALKLHQQIKRN